MPTSTTLFSNSANLGTAQPGAVDRGRITMGPIHMSAIKLLCWAFLWLVIWNHARAEVIAVDPIAKAASEAGPTMTMLWEAAEPKLTIVAIMGGNGVINLTRNAGVVRNQTANMLKLLTDRGQSKSMINIVIFDSPYTLDGGLDITPRYSSDHLNRIESVIRYYKDKLKTPVVIMGHSNGAVSVSEFINRSEEDRNLIAGVILSGSRNDARISSEINFPVLVMHHQNDGCRGARPSTARSHFDRIKSLNKNRTEFKTIQGGTERGDPCTNGLHMYTEAYPEAAKVIEEFLLN